MLSDDACSLIDTLTNELTSFHTLDAYYRGKQPLSFLAPEVQQATRGRLRSMVVNWPRLVVDSIEDRLDVEGFRLLGEERSSAELWQIWQANDLDEWSQQAHANALVHGRSFVLVGENVENPSLPLITVESAAQITVQWDPRTRRIVSAAKRWINDGQAFATYYGLEYTQQYYASLPKTGGSIKRGDWKYRDEPIPNVMGIVPVVPFVNRPDLHRPFGESEMTDVIPITDAINKLCTDMLVSAEYHAMPRRWVTGVEMGEGQAQTERTTELIRQRWEEARASKVWATDNSNAKFGQFAEANLDNFVTAIGMLTGQAAAISGLPPHYFGATTDNPASADAIRSAEAPLVKRAKRKQRVFGGSWERVMRLALLVRDGEVDPSALSMETVWRDPETPTVAQKADAAVKLLQANAITVEQAQEDLGYTPVQIARMAEQRNAQALGTVRAQLAEAQRLQTEQGLSQQAAFAAVGLLQAANAMGQQKAP